MKPTFNKDETRMEFDGKKFIFKPQASTACRGCAFYNTAVQACVFQGHPVVTFELCRCFRISRVDKRSGIWVKAPAPCKQSHAALSLSQIAALLQGKPVKTCLGTLTLKKE